MKRLRDQQSSGDPIIARTARMFASVEALSPSDYEMARVLAGVRSRSRRRGRPLLIRFAVAALVLFGFLAVAGATVGRQWVERVVFHKAPAKREVNSGVRSHREPPAPLPPPVDIPSPMVPPAPAGIPRPTAPAPLSNKSRIDDDAPEPKASAPRRSDVVRSPAIPIPASPQATERVEEPSGFVEEPKVPPVRAALPPKEAAPAKTVIEDEAPLSPEFAPVKPGSPKTKISPNDAPILPARL